MSYARSFAAEQAPPVIAGRGVGVWVLEGPFRKVRARQTLDRVEWKNGCRANS